MKPAPFQYHAPTTIEETLDLLAQYADDDGRVLAGGQSLVPTMAFRLARPRISSTSTASSELDQLEVENGKLCIGAARAPRRVREAGRGRPARPPADRRWCATSRISRSAPAARSAAASRTPTRPPNGARWRRRSTPRWWPRASAAACASSPARRFLQGHHDDRAARGRAAARGAAADPAEGRLCRASPSSAAAPATTRSPWRSRPTGCKNGVMSDMRVARRRRRGRAAPHRRGRAHADRPAAQPRHLPGRRARRGKAVDPLDDASISADYRRGVVRAMVVRALEQRLSRTRRMNDATGATKWIGQSVERLEDPPLVTGRGRFAGDINFPRQLHMRLVRSNHAHANIISIYTDAARRLPGVVAVWTAADIADVPPIDFREGPIEKLAPYRQPVLASTRCATSASRWPWCSPRTPMSPRTPPISSPWRSRNCRCCSTPAAEPGEFSFGRDTEAAVLHPGLWRRRRGVQVGAAHRRAQAHQRPALRRAAGDAAARSAAMTPRATCWSCTAPPRCRTGTRS